ncbi:MAG: hypothetical protein IOD12_07305, partial [Silvanigrellales bacterium]|nr:hypothetical protein [Silvanigrellales bacterium]
CSLALQPSTSPNAPAASAASTLRPLTCRTTEGTEIVFKEGQRRLSPVHTKGLVRLAQDGLCHIGEESAFGCFNGDGEKILFRDAQGRTTSPLASKGAWTNSVHACVLDNKGAARCFFQGSGDALPFANEVGTVDVVGAESLAMGDDFVCAQRKNAAPALECFSLPKVSPAGETPAKALRLTLTTDTGRRWNDVTLPSGGAEALGSHFCVVPDSTQKISCFDATGKALTLKNAAGFPAPPLAQGGLFLGRRSVCALDAKGLASCHALPTGELLRFRNALDSPDSPPPARRILMEDTSLCFLPRSESLNTFTCFVDGKRTPFFDTSGRLLSMSPPAAKGAQGDSAHVAQVAQLAQHEGNLVCSTSLKGSLACFDVSTGKAIAFQNDGGFPTEVDASAHFALSTHGICAVSKKSGKARCFRRSGESMAFKKGFGGRDPLDGIERLWIVNERRNPL